MKEPIYPEELTKIIKIPKQGYNSLSVLKDNGEEWEIQLYNPSVKPEETAAEKSPASQAETLDNS